MRFLALPAVLLGTLTGAARPAARASVAVGWVVLALAAAYQFAWFNRYLKGGDSAGPQPNTVRYFLMGGGSGEPTTDAAGAGHLDIGGTWQTAASWPLLCSTASRASGRSGSSRSSGAR